MSLSGGSLQTDKILCFIIKTKPIKIVKPKIFYGKREINEYNQKSKNKT